MSLDGTVPCTVRKGFSLWLFGPPAAGKTTVGTALRDGLVTRGLPAVLLDGGIVRDVVGADVGRDTEGRFEMTRRYAALSALLTESPIVTILAANNHTEAQRAYARNAHPPGRFGLVWIKTAPDVCRSRDPDRLYAWAESELAAGRSPNVVGVDLVFEEPGSVDVVIDTAKMTADEAALRLFDYLLAEGAIGAAGIEPLSAADHAHSLS